MIGDGGGTLIGHDGATLIANQLANVVSNDGAGLIGNDGAGFAARLIGNDGAGLLDIASSVAIGLGNPLLLATGGAALTQQIERAIDAIKLIGDGGGTLIGDGGGTIVAGGGLNLLPQFNNFGFGGANSIVAGGGGNALGGRLFTAVGEEIPQPRRSLPVQR